MRLLRAVPVVVLAFLFASCTCVVGADEGERLVTVSAPEDATGSGWVDIYLPAFEPGATNLSCYLEPGGNPCVHAVEQGAAFEVLATGDYQSSFEGWDDACSGAAPLCSVAASDVELAIEARFEGNVPTRRVYLDSLAINGNGLVQSSLGTEWRPPELGVSVSRGPTGGPGLSVDDTPGATQPLDIPLDGGLALTVTVVPDPGLVATRIDVFSLGIDPVDGGRTRAYACQSSGDSCSFTLQYADYLPDEHLTMWIQFFEADDVGSSGSGLAPAASVAPTGTATAGPTEPVVDLSGSWAITVDVTAANGWCAGDQDDPPVSQAVTMTVDGESALVSGLGNPGESWAGTWQGSTLRFGGMRDEDRGTTTAVFELAFDAASDRFVGTELWSWTGVDDDGVPIECPNGESDVVMVRG